MIVYRGPRQKEFSDDSHERTDVVDVSTQAVKTHERITIQFNVSKKDAEQRKVVTTIVLDATDVVALTSMMSDILLKRVAHLEEESQELRECNTQLHQIREIARGMDKAKNQEHLIYRLRVLLGLCEQKSFTIRRPEIRKRAADNSGP